MIVYLTVNILNNKFYVGQSQNDDDWNYYGSGVYLKRAIKKYGKENFQKFILQYCNSRDELNEREKFWIKLTRAQKLGYNITDGGEGSSGYVFTDEDKLKMSKASIGKKKSKEHCNNMKNRIWTQEQRNNIRKSRLGKKHSEETIIKLKNKKYSEEIKNKMSVIKQKFYQNGGIAGMSGKHHTEESNIKNSISQKERYKNGAINGRSKFIIIDGIKYNTIKDACKTLNITRYEIRNK